MQLGSIGERGERSRCTLARIVRGIATGAVRTHLLAREALVASVGAGAWQCIACGSGGRVCVCVQDAGLVCVVR